jgi:NADPH:quinone reductase-like Zn-dependent oxidoreductase
MRVLELQDYGKQPCVAEKPVPRPGPGEVLIRIAAAPVNPADVMFLRGLYGVKKPLPVVPGIEGSGTVVAAGPGLIPRLLLGRRVGCVSSMDRDGTWAEYMVTKAMLCVPLLKSVELEQGAMMFVNPWTAWAFLEIARRGRHDAAVHTAAASALGRMVLRLGLKFQYPIIHVVRRQAQVDLLRNLGAAHVLDSSDSGFDTRLRELCRQLGATVAFDAVAGEMTGRLLSAMPNGGRVILYGALSEAACTVQPGQLIFKRKSVEGFWLPEWNSKRTIITQWRTAYSIQKLLAADLRTEVHARVGLQDAVAGIEAYMREMSKGKVLIMP